MAKRRARRPRRRGVSIDKILDELIKTGAFSTGEIDRAKKQVAELKRERGNHGRRKSL